MPRLTEQEQQEIIRFIESGKPLPDKYRFLLFEDKREVPSTGKCLNDIREGAGRKPAILAFAELINLAEGRS